MSWEPCLEAVGAGALQGVLIGTYMNMYECGICSHLPDDVRMVGVTDINLHRNPVTLQTKFCSYIHLAK